MKKNREIFLDKEELKNLLWEIDNSSWFQRVFKQGKYGKFLS